LDQNISNAVARFTDGGDDANPVGDVLALKYGKQLTTTQLNYGGLNRLETTIFMLDDPFITESDPVTVAAYTQLGDVNKTYDYVQYYFEQNWQQEEVLICNFISGSLDFGSNSVVLDGTQTTALSVSGTTYTLGVGSNRFVGDLKALSVTLINGATTSGLINSGGVLAYPDRQVVLTNLVLGSRLYVFDKTNNNVLFNELAIASTFTGFVASDGTDVDLLIRVRNASGAIKYKQFLTEATLTAAGVSITVNQPLDQ